MKRREITARLMATFLGELEEQVAVMNDELLGLEAAPGDSERLSSLFRIAHTLKGASRAVGVRSVERVCHALEALLQRMIDGSLEVGPDQLSLLYAAADTLSEAGTLPDGPDAIAEDRIDSLVDALRSGSPEPLRKAASTAPSGGSRPSQSESAGLPLSPASAGKVAPMATATQEPSLEPAGRAEPQRPGVSSDPDRQVRVNAQRLAELVAATTRLEAARSGVAVRHADLESVNDLAGRMDRKWRKLARQLRRLEAVDGSTALGHDLDAAGDDLRTLADLVERLTAGSRRSAHAIAQSARDVADSTRQLRMRPFAEACEGLPRALRDLAAAAGKQVQLDVRGGDIEADRAVLDGLREAILQLVRNAVDHGIEAPAERARAGKPVNGRIRIAAALTGDRLAVTVSDDGAGLDLSAIRAELERRGRPVPETDSELARAIFEGGLSTRDEVTPISGRGVGLDIVQHAAEQIRGSVTVAWDAGEGTAFTITCPPTLTMFRAVIVSVNDQLLAIPTASVDRMLRLSAPDVRIAEGRQLLTGTGEPVPLVPLSQLLPPLREQAREPRPVLVMVNGSQRLGIAVDELVTETEIVLRPLHAIVGQVTHVSGAAMLGPGRVALVLNPASLIAAGLHARAETAQGPVSSDERQVTHRILVVDDSITTRTLEQSILAAAGYRVLTAVDGAEGWNVLREQGADLVVADVEMPRMDGFALCEAIRRSQRFSELPVVLVTALDSTEHRARGLEAGADAYIVKSGFDQQNLLDTVRQLLG
jgi:two-component system chemotaxis sensor kinase CheA